MYLKYGDFYMKIVVFRTLGGFEIGYGHVYRCISLAKAIRQIFKNLKIIFIINNEISKIIEENKFEYIISESFDFDFEILNEINSNLVIFDSYEANDLYLEQITKISKLLLFDDNNDLYDTKIADIILNGNIHAKDLSYNIETSTKYLLGLKYLVMREDYWDTNSIDNIKNNEILITTGGADSKNISPKIISSLKEINLVKKIVIGPGYADETIDEIYKIKDKNTKIIMKPTSLINHIKNSKYVISAAGSTIYEILSLNRIPIIFSIAKNQNIAYKYLEKNGIKTIGKYPNIKYNEIKDYIDNFVDDDLKQNQLVDGKGAMRVALYLKNFLSNI